MGAVPAGVLDFVDDCVLALLEIGGIIEPFDDLGPVGFDDAQLEPSSWHREDLALQKLSLPFEPPEHGRSPFFEVARQRGASYRTRAGSWYAGASENRVSPASRSIASSS